MLNPPHWRDGTSQKEHRADDYEGLIYEFDPKVEAPKKEVESLRDLRDVVRELGEISGNWLSDMQIDGEEYWSLEDQQPTRHVPASSALPSDARYREDLIWLMRGNEKYA